MKYDLASNAPIVVDIELHEGSGTAMASDGVTTLKMFMVDTLLSNGSRGPVVYSAEAMWKLFCTLHDLLGAQFHQMIDTPEYAEFMKDYTTDGGHHG